MISVTVLGAGSWGTALALQLARNKHPVTLWGHNSDHIRQLAEQRCNQRYLPMVKFPDNLFVDSNLQQAVQNAEQVLVVVPSHAFATTLTNLSPFLATNCGFSWATKGLEHGTGRFLHEVIASTLGPEHQTAMISGPSFAAEVAQGLPTALTIASDNEVYALQVASLLHGNNMLTYTNSDVIGVEIGGACKNVLAIAAGIADGLGFGANARAALITRGLAEMVRLGLAVGGKRETFMGLTGIGDLMLTCTDNQSRNRRFGLALGQGKTVTQASSAIGQVVEGAAAVSEIMRLSKRHQVEMPISEQVEKILYHNLSARQAVQILLSRPPRPEQD